MYDLFITYWSVGIVYVVVFQLISLIYKKSLGDDYIYEDKGTPFLIAVAMNLLLSILYPIFTIILMIGTLDASQKRKHLNVYMKDIEEKLNKLKGTVEEDKKDEQD